MEKQFPGGMHCLKEPRAEGWVPEMGWGLGPTSQFSSSVRLPRGPFWSSHPLPPSILYILSCPWLGVGWGTMAVSKQNFYLLKEGKVNSIKVCLFNPFLCPRVDLLSLESGLPDSPSTSSLPFYLPALLFVSHLPTYSSSSGLLPVATLVD